MRKASIPVFDGEALRLVKRNATGLEGNTRPKDPDDRAKDTALPMVGEIPGFV